MPNRNASATITGFEYQVNVAIYFMFKYLKEISSINFEGEKEDVEVSFQNSKKMMIQSKAQTKDLYDDHNNLSKLNKSLISLAESDGKDVQSLCYVSNMLNPLKTTSSEFDYPGITFKYYNELSEESKKIIDEQIEKNVNEKRDNIYNINTDKLAIIKLPFFGNDYDERHKFIMDEAMAVLTMMSDTLRYKSKSFISFCEGRFLDSGSDTKITISKQQFCDWIILTELESMDLSNDSLDIGIEETEYYDAYQKYRDFIDGKISNYENYMRVYSLYNKKRLKESISINDFVKSEKVSLYNYFFQDNLLSENDIDDKKKLDVYISQILSYAILKKKSIIEKIKKEANL